MYIIEWLVVHTAECKERIRGQVKTLLLLLSLVFCLAKWYFHSVNKEVKVILEVLNLYIAHTMDLHLSQPLPLLFISVFFGYSMLYSVDSFLRFVLVQWFLTALMC